ncbi:hypothetical protein [Nocardioides limicola]|uniref:hypothetical protein n=1 Tax=Nocardioides limicola TaxID=2803368 RepID=UPI00193B8430|nr:hypothetical protein [Nocardioides sp. DJM-14]
MSRRTVHLLAGLPGTGAADVDTALRDGRTLIGPDGREVAAGGSDAAQIDRAVIDVRHTHKEHGLRRRDVAGEWDSVCRGILKHKGATVIAHEGLASADRDQVALMLDGLSGCKVHLWLTVPDLGSQLSAAWTALVNAGQAPKFERYADRVLAGDTSDPVARDFWTSRDPVEVIGRWLPALKPGRIHVVIPHDDPASASWQALVASGFTGDTAVEFPTADPPAPLAGPDLNLPLLRITDGWTKAITAGGFEVHGDPADLAPTSDGQARLSGDDADLRLQLTTTALARAMAEVAQLRADNAALAERASKAERKWRKLHRQHTP